MQHRLLANLHSFKATSKLSASVPHKHTHTHISSHIWNCLHRCSSKAAPCQSDCQAHTRTQCTHTACMPHDHTFPPSQRTMPMKKTSQPGGPRVPSKLSSHNTPSPHPYPECPLLSQSAPSCMTEPWTNKSTVVARIEPVIGVWGCR